MKNRTELVRRALSELGRLYPGESPSAGDFESLNSLVDPLLGQLSAEEIAYVGDVEQIEPAMFLSLGRLLAIEAANEFGTDATQTLLTRNRAANVDALKDREQAILRRVSASATVHKTRAVDFM